MATEQTPSTADQDRVTVRIVTQHAAWMRAARTFLAKHNAQLVDDATDTYSLTQADYDDAARPNVVQLVKAAQPQRTTARRITGEEPRYWWTKYGITPDHMTPEDWGLFGQEN